MHRVPFRLDLAVKCFIKTLAIETGIFSQLSETFMFNNMTKRYNEYCGVIILVGFCQVLCDLSIAA